MQIKTKGSSSKYLGSQEAVDTLGKEAIDRLVGVEVVLAVCKAKSKGEAACRTCQIKRLY